MILTFLTQKGILKFSSKSGKNVTYTLFSTSRLYIWAIQDLGSVFKLFCEICAFYKVTCIFFLFSSMSFIILGCTFKLLFYFKLMFTYSMWFCIVCDAVLSSVRHFSLMNWSICLRFNIICIKLFIISLYYSDQTSCCVFSPEIGFFIKFLVIILHV